MNWADERNTDQCQSAAAQDPEHLLHRLGGIWHLRQNLRGQHRIDAGVRQWNSSHVADATLETVGGGARRVVEIDGDPFGSWSRKYRPVRASTGPEVRNG